MLATEPYAQEMRRRALGYIDDVLAGRVLVGELVRRAVERQVEDLHHGPARGLVFDEQRALHVFRFFSYLTHWKGEWVGCQLELQPWQAFIVWCLFGWLREEDRARRYRQAYIQVGKKNGKSLIAAGIGYYCFAADGEAGAEVYSAATKRDQARITHADAVQMRLMNPELRRRCEAYKDNLSSARTGSKFEPLGSNVDSTDGINVHCAIVDEVHRHKSPRLVNVLKYSMAARRQPLLFEITTAGDSVDSYCYEQREYCEQVLTGAVPAESQFAYIAELDKDDDWRDPDLWIKANPNLGVSKRLDAMLERLNNAQHIASEAADFKRYECNLWVVGALERWMDVDAWSACPKLVARMDPGRPCWLGLDLASTQDVAAAVLYWPPTADDPLAHSRQLFWVPATHLEERERHHKVPLREWVDQGHVIATPGPVIDYRLIVAELVRLRGRYAVQEVGYDDWNATEPVRMLEDEGYREQDLVPLPQTVKTYHAPMSRVLDLVAERRLCHGHNPCMRWMVSNVRAAADGSGRKKPMKHEGKRARKIDGPAALLMAVARQMTREQPSGSVYERRGLTELHVDDG